MRAILLALLLSACAPNFARTEDIERATVEKIETTEAPRFCSALMESPKRGCAVRITNTETKSSRCVVVMLPNDAEAAAHEAGHCLGFDHP